jgi:hypothetical protein
MISNYHDGRQPYKEPAVAARRRFRLITVSGTGAPEDGEQPSLGCGATAVDRSQQVGDSLAEPVEHYDRGGWQDD